MSDVPTTQNIQLPNVISSAVGKSGAAVLASIPTPPPSIAYLPAGADVRAAITLLTGEGAQINVGDTVTDLRTNLSLPPDALLDMKLISIDDKGVAHMRILSVNGHPISQLLPDPVQSLRQMGAQAPTATQAAPLPAPALSETALSNLPTETQITISKGTAFPATLISGSATAPNTPTQMDVPFPAGKGVKHLPLGSQLTLQLEKVTLPKGEAKATENQPLKMAQATATKAAPQTAGTAKTATISPAQTAAIIGKASPAQATTATAAAKTAAAQKISPLLSAQETAGKGKTAGSVARMATPMPTKSPAGAYSAHLSTGTIGWGENPSAVLTRVNATVLPGTMGGSPILRTDNGALIALQTQTPLPPGAQVSLAVTSATPPIAQADVPPPLPLSAGMGWPALDEALTTLQQKDPAAAARIGAALPALNKSLPANMIAFTNALQIGDINAWVGSDVLQSIRHFAPQSAQRLERDFRELASRAKDEKEWRPVRLPLQTSGGIQAITMIVHYPKQDAEEDTEAEKRRKKGSDPGTRFLIEVNLSQLGPIQIDGLAHEKERRLDLVMRLKKAFPEEISQEIRRIFNNTMQAIDYAGTISLSVTEDFFNPPEEEDLSAPSLHQSDLIV